MLKKFSNEKLLSKTKALAAEERRITLTLIEALQEVERRMLFAELGYGSLFEFAVKYLGLSEGAAHRRVQASRLVRDVPGAGVKLLSGELSLTNAAKVEQFCRAEKKLGHEVEKAEITAQVTGLSQVDCESKLFALSPRALPRESRRVVSGAGDRQLKIVVSEALYQKVERLRGLLAHSHPEASLAELLEVMADATLEREEKKRLGSGAASRRQAGEEGTPEPMKEIQAMRREEAELALVPGSAASRRPAAGRTEKLPSGTRVHLPRAIQRAVWSKAAGRCEYERDGHRCSSRYRLEIDHRVPLSRGGANSPDNLRLLCRVHNTQQARAMGVGLGS
jgi:hypothetical protein